MKTQAYSLWLARTAPSSRLRIAREKVAQAVDRGTPGPSPSRKVNATAFSAGYRPRSTRAVRCFASKRSDRKRGWSRHKGPSVAWSFKYFSSSAAKNALESRTKSASLSFTTSPTLSFRTDFSGGSLSDLPPDIGHSGSVSTCSFPPFSRIELHRTRTSFNGLPSLPSI